MVEIWAIPISNGHCAGTHCSVQPENSVSRVQGSLNLTFAHTGKFGQILLGGCSSPPPPLPPLPFVPCCFSRRRFVLRFFFLRCAPPLSLAFLGFRPRVPRALALCAVCFVGLPLLGSPCALASFVVSPRPLAAPWWLLPPPPPLLCLAVFLAAALCSVFFFRFAPPLSLAFSGFRPRVAWALALWVFFCRPPASRLSVRSRLFCVSRLAIGCFVVFAAPPPPRLCVSRFSSLPLGALFFFFLRRFSPPAPPPPLVRAWCLVLSGVAAVRCPSVLRAVLWCLALLCCGLLRAVRCLLGCLFLCCAALLVAAACCAVSLVVPSGWVVRGVACCLVLVCVAVCRAVLCVPGCGASPRCCASCLPVLCCCVLCCFVALVWCRCLLCRVLWRCPSPWGPVLCCAVFCGVPPRCVLCAVCVLSWRAGARCCSPLCCVLCVSWGVALCVPCPLRSVRCCVPLCSCACVVLFVWCVLLLAPGAVVRCCVLRCFLWCSVVRCWVRRPVVVCWLCVSVSVSLSGRVVWFPVAGVVCCGALLPCVVFCGAVLSRGAVLLCSAAVLRCCLCLLCPHVACRAVLCCAVGCLCCFVPGGGVCVLWCPVPPCRHGFPFLKII